MGKGNGGTRASTPGSPRVGGREETAAEGRRRMETSAVSIISGYLRNGRNLEEGYDFDVNVTPGSRNIELQFYGEAENDARELADILQGRLQDANIVGEEPYEYSERLRKVTFFPNYSISREELTRVRLR